MNRLHNVFAERLSRSGSLTLTKRITGCYNPDCYYLNDMKFTVGIIALFILPGSALAFWEGIQMVYANNDLLKYFLIGIVTGSLLYFMLIRRWTYFLTFEHEFTHAFMSILFFRKIEKFVVTKKDGGVVYHSGGFGGEFGNIMITMAPYFFPTFTVITLLFQPLVPPEYFPYYLIIVGITFAYHHLSTLRETRENWNSRTFAEAGSGITRVTDIAKSGYIFSFIFIITTTLFFNALVLWLLNYSYRGFFPLMKVVFYESFQIYKLLFIKIAALSATLF